MPKIIENLENKLIEEAKKQIEESGYSAMTIRSVAKGCGVGVGTVYNYFPSKEDLVATFLLADWKFCIAAIETAGAEAKEPAAVVRCICDQLVSYTRRHQTVFRDADAVAKYTGSFGRYHEMLRSQLAAPLQRFCSSEFSALFIAEALLTWTMAGKTYDEIYGIVDKLF